MLAALLTSVFPAVVVGFAPSTIFAFFCGLMVLHLAWVLAMVPETKGVPFEELARRRGGRPPAATTGIRSPGPAGSQKR